MSAKTTIPIGTRFGMLVVESAPEYIARGIAHNGKYTYIRKRKFYSCVCDCGQRKKLEEFSLKYGNSTSCGCKRQAMYVTNRKHNTT